MNPIFLRNLVCLHTLYLSPFTLYIPLTHFMPSLLFCTAPPGPIHTLYPPSHFIPLIHKVIPPFTLYTPYTLYKPYTQRYTSLQTLYPLHTLYPLYTKLYLPSHFIPLIHKVIPPFTLYTPPTDFITSRSKFIIPNDQFETTVL